MWLSPEYQSARPLVGPALQGDGQFRRLARPDVELDPGDPVLGTAGDLHLVVPLGQLELGPVEGVEMEVAAEQAVEGARGCEVLAGGVAEHDAGRERRSIGRVGEPKREAARRLAKVSAVGSSSLVLAGGEVAQHQGGRALVVVGVEQPAAIA